MGLPAADAHPLVVTDLKMPQMSGMELLFKTRGLPQPPHVIILTGYGTVEVAVQAMARGAFSFLEKPFDPKRYIEIVRDALAGDAGTQAAVTDTGRFRPLADSASAAEPILESPAIRRVYDVARWASATDSSVILYGESGTGKEVLADFIHRHSRRARGPIVKVNCGALPENLMESELFGHEKGAFTGADKRRSGRFEQAHGGTLFLDEIGDLLPNLQVKLLRALQDKVIERVGSCEPVRVDFRLICATHRDLRAAVAAGTFREDLFYRINVVPMNVPPLRERREDIIPLAQHFFSQLRSRLPNGPARLSPEALDCLAKYSWPGNVRQLRNAMEYALVLCREGWVRPEDLPAEVGLATSAPFASVPNAASMATGQEGERLESALRETETQLIRSALERHSWQIPAVLNDLGISRSRLYERMKEYGIRRPSAPVGQE